MEIDKLAFIFIKDRKILSTISKGKDTYYIPGGKREPGETDRQALTREVREELSVNLIPSSIRYYGTLRAQAHGKKEGTSVKMTCYTAKFRGKLKPAAEVERIAWITSKQSDSDRSSPVDRLILADLNTKNLID